MLTMTKTTGKEYFYKVPGLIIPKYMAPATLESDINHFIDWAPDNAGKLESISEDEDLFRGRHSFLPRMENLYTMLCSIQAHWLEREASRILRMAEIGEAGICKNLAIPFVSNLHTLILDIQMAQNGEFEANRERCGEIENYKDIISGANLISVLIENYNFEKALDIAESIDGLQESEYAASLTAHMRSGKTDKAAQLISEIVSVYTERIDATFSPSPKKVEQKKILLVDDMPETLIALNYMLQEHYQVFSLSSGFEALEFIEKKQVDAFILDIEMPEMDGFALAKKIREDPRHKDTPILFLTGNSTRETLVKALMHGAKSFIVKPANKDILISRLNTFL